MEKIDLLIVGNGLDLSLKLETTYLNYIDKSSSYSQNFWKVLFTYAIRERYIINDNWNGLENTIKAFILFVDKVISKKYKLSFDIWNQPYKSKKYRLELGTFRELDYDIQQIIELLVNFNDDISPFLVYGVNNIGEYIRIYGDCNFSSLNNTLYLESTFYVGGKGNENIESFKNKVIEHLNRELYKLEEDLKKYILKVYNEANKDGFFLHYLRQYQIENVLNFNYTDSIKYIESDTKVYYVHGSINGDVVLGIEDVDELKGISCYNYFFKKFRRILKETNKEYNSLVNSLNQNSVVAVYGHSLERTDYSILYEIFQKKFSKYIIFCYNPNDEKSVIDEYKYRISKLIGLNLLDELYRKNSIEFRNVK